MLLGAAGLLGVDALVVAGGAQAIGALAYGLPDAGIEPVDRIVGPWQCVGDRGQDRGLRRGRHRPARRPVRRARLRRRRRPTRGASPLDLLTQAEHGPDSPAILVTTDASFATAVEREVGALLATANRRDILARSLAEHGRIVLAPDLDTAIDFVNDYAPEHLSVDVEPLEATVDRLRNAGSIFVGPWAPKSAGDYATGANHVLPTGGLARSSGGLAVEAYGKFVQVQRITREGLAAIAETVDDPRRSRGAAGPPRCRHPSLRGNRGRDR